MVRVNRITISIRQGGTSAVGEPYLRQIMRSNRSP